MRTKDMCIHICMCVHMQVVYVFPYSCAYPSRVHASFRLNINVQMWYFWEKKGGRMYNVYQESLGAMWPQFKDRPHACL